MRKDHILQTVISKSIKTQQIGENCSSAFAVVHQCIGAAADTKLAENEKKERLLTDLQSFWRGRSPFVNGCKREQVQKIVALVFGIRSERDRSLHREISQYTLQELYLYYCYVERLAKVDDYFFQLLRNRYGEKQRKLTEQRAAIEQAAKKEQEEEEQQRIAKMDKEEKWRYDIFTKQQDIDYFQKLTSEGEYSPEERVKIASLLEEYWKSIDKWEGKKISKKQILKVERVKEILDKAVNE